MNKAELIAAVAAKTGITKKQAAETIEAVTETITNTLKTGESVLLVGFGTFEAKKKDARTGRNPKTGEPIEIAARTVPGFKPGKDLKDAVA